MDVKYHNWLNIEVNHDYFLGNICSTIHFDPFESTTPICKNYNILMQKKSNTTSFFVGNRNSNIGSDDFKAIEPLYFQIVSENNHFQNFTNITPKEHSILFFKTTVQNLGSHMLQNSTYVSDENLITVKPPHFNIPLPNKTVQVEIKTASGTTVVKQSVDGQLVSNYVVDLLNQDTDIYQTWIDNQLQETFLVLLEPLQPNCIGILCIEPLKINNLNKGITLQLNFKARSTYRQYKVVVSDKRKITVSNISIRGGANEKYRGPEETLIVNGQTAQVFTSSVPIPLQKEPKSHPQLNIEYTNQFSNRNNQLEILLPNPNVETLKPYNLEQDTSSFCSTNIVYV